MQRKFFVISLGGSLVFPSEIDADFILKFKKLILAQTKKGIKFIIIVGGGKLCRNFNDALKTITKPSSEQLDWMGINTTWINAKLLQLALGKFAHLEIAKNPTKKIKFKGPILVGGGWKPGRSSDGAMIEYAKTYGASIAINLSNIDYVYTKDPKKFKNAKKIKNTCWNDFLKIVGAKWKPGANVPFDPIAAKEAKKNRLQVIIANGRNLKNLENILNGKKFKGTTIS